MRALYDCIKEEKSQADEIMINCLGRLEVTTAGIYYKPIKDLIDTIENKKLSKIEDYMIFCNPIVEEYAKQIAKYYEIKSKVTLFLPDDTLFVLTTRKIFEPQYKKMIEELGWNE